MQSYLKTTVNKSLFVIIISSSNKLLEFIIHKKTSIMMISALYSQQV